MVCVVLAAGCGGSSKKSASPTTTSTPAAPTSTSGTLPTFATKNCPQLKALGTKLAQALQTTSGNAETRLRKEAQLFRSYANAAPAEVRADFQTLAGAFTTYVNALLKAGIKPGTTPTAAQVAQIQAAAKAFDSPKLRVAERHLTAWAQKNCGGTG